MKEPEERKRAKRSDVKSYNNPEKARKYASSEEFAGNFLEERDGFLFCLPCQKFIRFTEKVDVSQHIFGARREAGKQKAKRHAENLKLLQLQLEEQNALEKAVVQHHEDVFARSQGKESARGATLPIDQSAERAHILETLLTLGILCPSSTTLSFKLSLRSRTRRLEEDVECLIFNLLFINVFRHVLKQLLLQSL